MFHILFRSRKVLTDNGNISMNNVLLKQDEIKVQLSLQGSKININKTNMVINILIIVTIIISIVGSIIPREIDFDHDGDGYAVLDFNGKIYGQCWVDRYYQLMSYGITFISVVFDVLCVILAFGKYNETKRYTSAYLLLIKRLLAWVVVFFCVRIIPLVVRLREIFDFQDILKTGLSLELLQNYMAVSTGIANGIVWCYIQRLNLNSKSNESFNNDWNHDRQKEIERMLTLSTTKTNVNINSNNNYQLTMQPQLQQNQNTSDSTTKGFPSKWKSFDTETVTKSSKIVV